MEQEVQYSIGEWVVHTQYGVGQIKKKQIMPLHGEQTECFMVQVKDGTFWFPRNTTENPRIRRVGSQEIIDKVIKNLRRKPGNLDKDKKYWTSRIKEVPPYGDLPTISQLIRDLSAQQSMKRLNDSQVKALTNYKSRLVQEWSAITGTEDQQVRADMNVCLRESKDKIPVE